MDVGRGDGVGGDVGEGEVVRVFGEDGDGEGLGEGGEAAGFPGCVISFVFLLRILEGGEWRWGKLLGGGLHSPPDNMAPRICQHRMRRLR